MSARILYHETATTTNPSGEDDVVRVELRLWKDATHHDLIEDVLVMVGGCQEMHTRTVLSGHCDAEATRHAIAQFDAHLASHPHRAALCPAKYGKEVAS